MKEQTFILQRSPTMRNLKRLVAFLEHLGTDSAWKVTVSEWKRTRSNEQNAFLWGCVYKTICDNLPGWDADDVHEYCLGECFGWETLEGFGKRRLRPIRRSSKLSTQEFSDYIAFIQRRMAEHGIYIEDPAERAA